MQFPCFPPYLLLEVLTWPAVLAIFPVLSFVFPYHWNKFQQEGNGIKVETLESKLQKRNHRGMQEGQKCYSKISKFQPYSLHKHNSKRHAGSIKVASFTLKTLSCQAQAQSGGR